MTATHMRVLLALTKILRLAGASESHKHPSIGTGLIANRSPHGASRPQVRTRVNMPRGAPHMPPVHRSLEGTIGPRHAAARQPLQVPRVVVRRRPSRCDERRLSTESSGCTKLTARAVSEAMTTCEWREWHARAPREVGGFMEKCGSTLTCLTCRKQLEKAPRVLTAAPPGLKG